MDLDKVFLDNTNSDPLKIDIVYTFVDPSDNKWMQKYKDITKNKRINSSRFDFTTEQIQFSLKTVEKYANWINNIFIVSDDQYFEPPSLFLKKKIKFIDHKDIIPEKYLPTFNSITIESFLWKINNLSQYFLYLNDDMFLGSKILPQNLFDKDKLVQFYGYRKQYNHPWRNNIQQTNVLFEKIYHGHKHIYPQHAPYFIQKDVMALVYSKFERFLKTMWIRDKTRTYNDYVHNLIFLYAMYASYHKYAINRHTSFSPIYSLQKSDISRFYNKFLRKKFYCFYSSVKNYEQKQTYLELQKAILE